MPVILSTPRGLDLLSQQYPTENSPEAEDLKIILSTSNRRLVIKISTKVILAFLVSSGLLSSLPFS
jgi:hypothetical protein